MIVKIPSKINSQGGLDGNKRTGKETDEVYSKREEYRIHNLKEETLLNEKKGGV